MSPGPGPAFLCPVLQSTGTGTGAADSSLQSCAKKLESTVKSAIYGLTANGRDPQQRGLSAIQAEKTAKNRPKKAEKRLRNRFELNRFLEELLRAEEFSFARVDRAEREVGEERLL